MESVVTISSRMMHLDHGGVVSFVLNQKTCPIMKLDRQLAWIVLILQ